MPDNAPGMRLSALRLRRGSQIPSTRRDALPICADGKTTQFSVGAMLLRLTEATVTPTSE
jgi:hypothetical protein